MIEFSGNCFQGFYRTVASTFTELPNLRFKTDCSQLSVLPKSRGWWEAGQWLKCQLLLTHGWAYHHCMGPCPSARTERGPWSVLGHQLTLWLCFVTVCAQWGCDHVVDAFIASSHWVSKGCLSWALAVFNDLWRTVEYRTLRGATMQCRRGWALG